jgi:hypothetical protein
MQLSDVDTITVWLSAEKLIASASIFESAFTLKSRTEGISPKEFGHYFEPNNENYSVEAREVLFYDIFSDLFGTALDKEFES